MRPFIVTLGVAGVPTVVSVSADNRWYRRAGGRSDVTPAVSHGLIFIRTDAFLYAIGQRQP